LIGRALAEGTSVNALVERIVREVLAEEISGDLAG
jgi:hypothetical protein